MSTFSEEWQLREVPNFTGLDYQGARALEQRTEVHIADPDPDAPPITSHWWENQQLVVRRQDPPAGAWVARYDSVRVTLTEPDQSEMARLEPHVPQPVLSAEAHPDRAVGND